MIQNGQRAEPTVSQVPGPSITNATRDRGSGRFEQQWRRCELACDDDMIEIGIVASLAHPGGNFTGLNKMTPEYTAKRLDLLKDMLPEATYEAIAEKVPAFQKAKA